MLVSNESWTGWDLVKYRSAAFRMDSFVPPKIYILLCDCSPALVCILAFSNVEGFIDEQALFKPAAINGSALSLAH